MTKYTLLEPSVWTTESWLSNPIRLYLADKVGGFTVPLYTEAQLNKSASEAYAQGQRDCSGEHQWQKIRHSPTAPARINNALLTGEVK